MALTKIKTGGITDNAVTDAKVADAITVTAATISGSTLASGVTASSLTSVGTLSSLNTSGNIGLGVTPDTWHSSYDALQGANFSLSTDASAGASKSVTLAYNQYIDSGNAWTYINADEASYYQQYNGAHYFATAGAGSADGDVTNSTRLTIANDGTSTFAKKVTIDNDAAEHLTLKRDGSHWWDIQVGGNGNLNIQKNSATDNFLLDASGNVGVGAIINDFTPTLGVTGAQPGLVLDDSATEAFLVAYCDGDASVMMYDHSDDFIIKQAESIGGSSAADVLKLDSSKNATFAGKLVLSGNPNIVTGTSDGSDNATLEICGGGAAAPTRGGYIFLRGNQTSNGSISVEAGYETGVSSGEIVFKTNNNQRLTLTNDGRVGIGDSSPTTGIVCINSGDGSNTVKQADHTALIIDDIWGWQLLGTDGDVGLGQYKVQGGTGHWMYKQGRGHNNSNDFHKWYTNDTERVNINKDGVLNAASGYLQIQGKWFAQYGSATEIRLCEGYSAPYFMSNSLGIIPGSGMAMLLLQAASGEDSYISWGNTGAGTYWKMLHDNSDSNKLFLKDMNDNDGVYIAHQTTAWAANTSDERKKDNWEMFENATDKINTLTKVGTYQRIDPDTKELISDKRIVGISANEVQKVLPLAVDEHKDGYLGLRYQDVSVLMLKAIQELSSENNDLKARIEALEGN